MKTLIKVTIVLFVTVMTIACEGYKTPRKDVLLCNVIDCKFTGQPKKASQYAIFDEFTVTNEGGEAAYVFLFFNTDGNNQLDRNKGESIVEGFIPAHTHKSWKIHLPEANKIAIAVSFTQINFQITWFENTGEFCGTWASTLNAKAAVGCDQDGCYDDAGNPVSEEEMNYPDAVTEESK